MKLFIIVFSILLLVFYFNNLSAKSSLPGKNLFYNSKGKHGSCNSCHAGGGSAGRWNFETKQIDPEEGRKIPSLKGIGKRKSQEQIERAVKLMQKMFDFKLTNEQISQLAEYVGTL